MLKAALVLLAVVVVVAIVGLLVVVAQRRRARFLADFSNIKDKKAEETAYQNRLAELETAMDRLVAENKVVWSLDDAYLLIHNYISCRNLEELNYCQAYLKKKYGRGYLRYDRERR